MNAFIYTLGCRLNQCESEAIAEAFEKNGHNVLKTNVLKTNVLKTLNTNSSLNTNASLNTSSCLDTSFSPDTNTSKDDGSTVDLVIVNTCTVTSKAEQKARRMIRLYATKCPVLVTGCYAQMNAKGIEALGTNVVVLPLVRKPELLKLPQFFDDRPGMDTLEVLHEFAKEPHNLNRGAEFNYAPIGFTYHCRSYLKVQDGCDNNCGYCRVHVARGRATSLDSDIAVQRALEIEKKGYHEIVLTGVNLTMYDHNGRGLGGLLEKLLAQLGTNIRIRLSSLEPDNVDNLLLEQLEDFRVQPHFHIPIQSAAPKVMARINRNYSLEHLEYVVKRLREIKKDPFLACDIITGLPAEGDEEFEETKAFLIVNRFAMMHVFPFSPRPNTPLEHARDKAPESVRDERARVLRELALKLNEEYLNRQIGRKVDVILEENKKGTWYGLTGNYMRVKVNDAPLNSMCGDLVIGIVTSYNTVSCI